MRSLCRGQAAVALALTVLISAASQPAPAQARQRAANSRIRTGAPSPQYDPPSFSNSVPIPPRPGAHQYPVSQQEVADAVLAGALQDMNRDMDRHFHEGEYNHVVNISRIIVQGDPENTDAFEDAAWLLWSTDRDAEAVAFLKQGIQGNAHSFALYFELGNHYVLNHDWSTGIPYLETAVKYPCPYRAWHLLAHCYEHTNQWDKALKTWETAVSRYTDDLVGLPNLKRVRAEVARRHAAQKP